MANELVAAFSDWREPKDIGFLITRASTKLVLLMCGGDKTVGPGRSGREPNEPCPQQTRIFVLSYDQTVDTEGITLEAVKLIIAVAEPAVCREKERLYSLAGGTHKMTTVLLTPPPRPPIHFTSR